MGNNGILGLAIIVFVLIAAAAFLPSMFYNANAGANLTPGSQYANVSNATNNIIVGGLAINFGLLVIVGAAFVLLAIGAFLNWGR